MALARLLILPALAALLSLALTAAPASADPATNCPCWPGGPPLVEPTFCYQSPTAQLNTFAYLAPPPTFLQVTNGWCRNGGAFKWVTPAEAQFCHQQLQCLCSGNALRPDELCNGSDDNCDGFVDEGFPLGQFCEDGLGDCRVTGGLICDPNDATGTTCDATALDPTEPGAELTCTGGGDEDCDGQIDCADPDCAWDASKLPDLTCKDPVRPDGIVDVNEQCDGDPCCTASCTLEPSGTLCGIAETCQQEVCDASGECVLETLPGTCDVDPAGMNDACDVNADVCQAGVCTNTDPTPVAEVICNGIDDDCNPSTPDQLVETCNGIDDDCDGEIDEGFGQTTCGEGVCTTTVANCVGGEPQTCEPLDLAGPELCHNGIDDDCDGAVDEPREPSQFPRAPGHLPGREPRPGREVRGDEVAGRVRLPGDLPGSGLLGRNDLVRELQPRHLRVHAVRGARRILAVRPAGLGLAALLAIALPALPAGAFADPATCGNGQLDPGEECDGTTPATCETLRFAGGTLSCTPTCELDTSACQRASLDEPPCDTDSQDIYPFPLVSEAEPYQVPRQGPYVPVPGYVNGNPSLPITLIEILRRKIVWECDAVVSPLTGSSCGELTSVIPFVRWQRLAGVTDTIQAYDPTVPARCPHPDKLARGNHVLYDDTSDSNRAIQPPSDRGALQHLIGWCRFPENHAQYILGQHIGYYLTPDYYTGPRLDESLFGPNTFTGDVRPRTQIAATLEDNIHTWMAANPGQREEPEMIGHPCDCLYHAVHGFGAPPRTQEVQDALDLFQCGF